MRRWRRRACFESAAGATYGLAKVLWCRVAANSQPEGASRITPGYPEIQSLLTGICVVHVVFDAGLDHVVVGQQPIVRLQV